MMGKEGLFFDIFEREQAIFDNAVKRCGETALNQNIEYKEYKTLVKEYGRLLKQLRQITKISDRATGSLCNYNIKLLSKIHLDALTGIYNRRYLDESLCCLIKTLSRTNGFLSVMMIDIDFFKKYNDNYGHNAGDECLKIVSQTISESVTRGDDFVARYGGEEFVVVMPMTTKEGATLIAERIQANVLAKNIVHAHSDVGDYITVSIGFTYSKVNFTQCERDYIKKADEALYLSKQNGRNCYTFLEFKGADNEL